MVSPRTQERERSRRDRAKTAIALAMQNRWWEARGANLAILKEFPNDLEAHNRLGKALTELGRNREAVMAFRSALQISPHNSIARKNLGRLIELGDDAPRGDVMGVGTRHVFIEESGKAGVTSLINLADTKSLLKLSPGHTLDLQVEGGGLRACSAAGTYIGQVEPRMASRLVRLIKGGNRYEATVTSVGQEEMTIIVVEVFQHPSQSGAVSFPSRGGNYPAYRRSNILGNELGDEEPAERDSRLIKDWSDDDTEPGDDDAFSPVVHRIISAAEVSTDDDL